jgi:cytochrome b561
MSPSRYHPALVVLHWFLAVFVVAALSFGTLVLVNIPNTSPEKLHGLRAHMGGGIAILVLMFVRFTIRTLSSKPEPATTGNRVLDRIAKLSHYGFYLLILLMATTGLATAYLSGLFGIVFSGSGAPLPISFMIFPTRVAHGIIAKLIIGLIGLHVLAALYHQFIRKDGLFRRMWFGRRWPRAAEINRASFNAKAAQ